MGYAIAKCKHGKRIAGMPSPDYGENFVENAQKLMEFGEFCWASLTRGHKIEFIEDPFITLNFCKECKKKEDND